MDRFTTVFPIGSCDYNRDSISPFSIFFADKSFSVSRGGSKQKSPSFREAFFRQIPNDGLGDCLPKAISQALFKTSDLHSQLRVLLGKFLRENEKMMKDFMDKPEGIYSTFVHEQTKPGFWLGDQALMVMCFL